MLSHAIRLLISVRIVPLETRRQVVMRVTVDLTDGRKEGRKEGRVRIQTHLTPARELEVFHENLAVGHLKSQKKVPCGDPCVAVTCMHQIQKKDVSIASEYALQWSPRKECLPVN